MKYNNVELSCKNLTENYNGKFPLRMCIIKNEKPVTKFAQCKDYFGDVVWSLYTGEKVNIYGFKFNYTKNQYNINDWGNELKFYFARCNHSGNCEQALSIEEYFPKIQKYLQLLTDELKTDPIIFEPAYDGFTVVLPEQIWKYKPYVLSFILYYIRACFDFTENDELNTIEKLLINLGSITNTESHLTSTSSQYAKQFIERKKSEYENGKLVTTITKPLKLITENENLLDRVERYTQFSYADIHDGHGILSYKKEN